MERVPLADPANLGWKVTVMVQDIPVPTLMPQVFVWWKEPFAMAMLLMLNAVLPVFVSVVVRVLLPQPKPRRQLTLPKSRLAGTIFTVPLVSVIVAPKDFVGSVTEVAVTAAVAGDGTAAGAVYVVGAPLKVLGGETIPHAGAHNEGGVPCMRVQLTPAIAGSCWTVEVNGCVTRTFAGISAELGKTETVIASTVTVTLPDCFGPDIEVAVMVTGKFAVGTAEGAVYVTEVVVRLLRLPPPGAGGVMVQDVGSTPIFAGSKLTVAVIWEVPVRQGRDGQACTAKGFADRETLMAAKMMTMVPSVAGGLADLAVIVTCTSLDGGVSGAV
jgi:hypothetical protein